MARPKQTSREAAYEAIQDLLCTKLGLESDLERGLEHTVEWINATIAEAYRRGRDRRRRD